MVPAYLMESLQNGRVCMYIFEQKYTLYKMTSHFGVLKLIYYKMRGFPPSNHYKMDLENPVYMGLDSSPFYRGNSYEDLQTDFYPQPNCKMPWAKLNKMKYRSQLSTSSTHTRLSSRHTHAVDVLLHFQCLLASCAIKSLITTNNKATVRRLEGQKDRRWRGIN